MPQGTRTQNRTRTKAGGRPVKPFKVLQINLNRCRLAQDIMIQNAWEMEVDIVVISEPYKQLPEWDNDGTGDASLWVTGFNGRFASVAKKLRAGGIVAAEIENTVIISCYCSPNRKVDFPKYLDELEDILKEAWAPGKRTIVTGDLNAEAVVWEGGKTDRRGLLCMGLLGRQGLVPIRPKGKYSFIRNGGTSMIDIMAIDRCTAAVHMRSTILPHPTESDHRYVLHTFSGVRPRTVGPAWIPYDIGSLDPERVCEECNREMVGTLGGNQEGDMEPPALKVQKALERVTKKVLLKKKVPRGTKRPNPWWTPEIASARKAMHTARRTHQRKRKKKRNEVEVTEARCAYAKAKRQLQITIWRAKEVGWSEMVDMVDSDPWGKPYKAVMARVKGRQPRKALSVTRAREIAEELFVTTPEEKRRTYAGSLRRWVQTRDLGIREKVTLDLVRDSIARIKPGKAPGLDQIPAEVVAIVGKNNQGDLRELIWDTIERGEIPATWKKARVVLIPKPGKDPREKGAYRPISVLPALSKVWEYAIKDLLEGELGLDPFHGRQFGFRRGSGTVDACMEVINFADRCRAKDRMCALIAIDVKNAFNAIRWPVILEELERRGILNALLKVMQN